MGHLCCCYWCCCWCYRCRCFVVCLCCFLYSYLLTYLFVIYIILIVLFIRCVLLVHVVQSTKRINNVNFISKCAMSNMTTMVEESNSHEGEGDDGRKTISISAKTHRELDSIGLRGETFDDIIQKCIREYKKNVIGSKQRGEKKTQ